MSLLNTKIQVHLVRRNRGAVIALESRGMNPVTRIQKGISLGRANVKLQTNKSHWRQVQKRGSLYRSHSRIFAALFRPLLHGSSPDMRAEVRNSTHAPKMGESQSSTTVRWRRTSSATDCRFKAPALGVVGIKPLCTTRVTVGWESWVPNYCQKRMHVVCFDHYCMGLHRT